MSSITISDVRQHRAHSSTSWVSCRAFARLRRPHPVEGQDRVVQALDRRQRVDVDVDHRQILVPVRGQLVWVALPAAPLVVATEMADDRRLPVARIAVQRRAVPRPGPAELVGDDEPLKRAMDVGVERADRPEPVRMTQPLTVIGRP